MDRLCIQIITLVNFYGCYFIFHENIFKPGMVISQKFGGFWIPDFDFQSLNKKKFKYNVTYKAKYFLQFGKMKQEYLQFRWLTGGF